MSRSVVAETADAAGVERLIERYVSLWNEPSPDRRRAIIRELWAPDGEHLLEPPESLRDASQALGFETPKLEIRGYPALERRAARAHEEFVAPGTYRFRARGNVARLRDLVKFNWEMVATASGEIVGAGLEIFQLDEHGRIAADYQFVEP